MNSSAEVKCARAQETGTTILGSHEEGTIPIPVAQHILPSLEDGGDGFKISQVLPALKYKEYLAA